MERSKNQLFNYSWVLFYITVVHQDCLCCVNMSVLVWLCWHDFVSTVVSSEHYDSFFKGQMKRKCLTVCRPSAL